MSLVTAIVSTKKAITQASIIVSRASRNPPQPVDNEDFLYEPEITDYIHEPLIYDCDRLCNV